MGTNETDSQLINNSIILIGFCVLYSIVFTVGVIGNGMVIYAVCRNKLMHTVTNCFIANLAISDILMSAFAVPLTPLYTFLGEWIFGDTLCHLFPFIQATSVYISTLTLMAIAIDRYYVIVYPFRPRMKLSTCYIYLIVIWVLSALLTCPYGIYMKVTEFKETHFCEEQWPSHVKHLFTITTTFIQFVIPFSVMTYCYVKVFKQLSSREKAKTRMSSTKCSQKEEADRERKRKVNRMLISMVVIFAGCWLPLTCVNIVTDFKADLTHFENYLVLFLISHVIAMSSICYNPFLYAWLNENFRREFKSITPCIVDKNNLRRISTTNTTFHETAVTSYSVQPIALSEEKQNHEEIPLQILPTVQETSSEYNCENASEETAKIQVSDNTKREWL